MEPALFTVRSFSLFYKSERALSSRAPQARGIAANPDTVRGPDVAFVRQERVPQPSPAGFAALAPDLVVEILSPNDRPGDVLAKVADWLSAGSQLVWVIDPDRRLARVYRADGTEATIGQGGELDGENVLPGFTCPLAGVLER